MTNKKLVNSVFFQMMIACVLSSLGLSLGSFSDVVIVGNAFGETGLGILNITMPIYMVFNLITLTIGTGSGVLISKNMSTCDFQMVKKYFTSTLALSLVVGLIVCVFGNIFIHPLASALGAQDALHDAAVEYIRYLLVCAPFFVLGPVVNSLLRTDGAQTLSTISSVCYVAINIVLDLVFIFVFKMGIPGAGLAIAIAQIVSLLISCLHFFHKDVKLRLTRPTVSSVGHCNKIVANGLGVSTASFYQAIIVMVNNLLLLRYFGVSAVSNYSVLFNAGFFVLAFYQGITFALAPIIGTYYGEKNNAAIKQTAHLILKTLLISAVGWSAVFWLFPRQIGMLFGIACTPELQSTLGIYGFAILFIGFNMIATAYFQSMHHKRPAFLVSLLNGIVLTLPLALLLLPRWGAKGVAVNFLIAEGCTTLFVIATLLRNARKVKPDGLYLIEERKRQLPIFETILQDDISHLGELASGIEQFCEENEIDMKRAYFINLFVEELMVKIFEKGFKERQKDKYVIVKLLKNENEVNIHIRDTATNYNPFHKQADESDEDRMGIDMVKTKALYFDYQRLLVFNNLYVIL